MKRTMMNGLAMLGAALLIGAAAACGGGDKKSEIKTATEAPAQAAVTSASGGPAQGAATQAAATQAPATQASGGQSVSASDLKRLADNWSKVKSFRARITVEQAGKPNTDGLMEVVRPDRLHFSFGGAPGQAFEVITIGNDTYTKIGPNWTKTTSSGPGGVEQIFKPSQIDDSVQKLTSAGVTKGGTDTVDGKRCQIYQAQGSTAGETPTELCLATDSGLPLRIVSQSAGSKSTTIFSDYNTNIDIKAPI